MVGSAEPVDGLLRIKFKGMETNQQLIDHLQHRVGLLITPELRQAFEEVDRGDFVDQDYWPEAYEDYPLPIGEGQTISQPTVVAFMLEKLAVIQGMRILDVGCGSGWTTALLAQLTGPTGMVVGVDRSSRLLRSARENVAKYSFSNVLVVEWSKVKGQYDRVLVSAAFSDQEQLINTLGSLVATDGRVVAPVGDSLMVFDQTAAGWQVVESFSGFRFVPYLEDQENK